ncbi:MAG TPA: hypothetical protein VEZ20_00515 [Allosphingosinicella sp.]|nr:hypothetical protein [Allosphingosinicella sp.]
MKMIKQIALSAALLTLAAGCGDGRGPDGLTSEERQKLDQHAANLDSGDIVDASPDSLVANDTLMATEGEEATDLNAGAAAPEVNAE